MSTFNYTTKPVVVQAIIVEAVTNALTRNGLLPAWITLAIGDGTLKLYGNGKLQQKSSTDILHNTAWLVLTREGVLVYSNESFHRTYEREVTDV